MSDSYFRTSLLLLFLPFIFLPDSTLGRSGFLQGIVLNSCPTNSSMRKCQRGTLESFRFVPSSDTLGAQSRGWKAGNTLNSTSFSFLCECVCVVVDGGVFYSTQWKLHVSVRVCVWGAVVVVGVAICIQLLFLLHTFIFTGIAHQAYGNQNKNKKVLSSRVSFIWCTHITSALLQITSGESSGYNNMVRSKEPTPLTTSVWTNHHAGLVIIFCCYGIPAFNYLLPIRISRKTEIMSVFNPDVTRVQYNPQALSLRS